MRDGIRGRGNYITYVKINMRDVILGDGGKRKEAAETVASSLARSITITPAGGGANGGA